MWLNRYGGHAPPSPASPLPQRRPSHLSPSRSPAPQIRPGLTPRASSLSPLINGSTESLPRDARLPNGSSLRNQLDASSSTDAVADPLDILGDILGPSPRADDGHHHPLDQSHDLDHVDFGELSLQQFAHIESPTKSLAHDDTNTPSFEEYEKEKSNFVDLHKSIAACDQVLKSVETYLNSFQADLAAVSAEIETLQQRSANLNTKLESRKEVEKLLGPHVETLAVAPTTIRRIIDGPIDDTWIKALEDVEKRSKLLEAKAKTGSETKSASDLRPIVKDLKDRATERVRDYVVTQIKALRAPGVNAQLLQQNAFLRYKDAFAFLSRHQPQLGEEISQAYINTMRWYYLHNFTRYKNSLDKLKLHVVDKTETLANEDAARKATSLGGTKQAGAPHDAFSIGRRMDILRSTATHALTSHVAEEDRSTHYLEVPFRAFNLTLVDNASAEYSFLSEFFVKQSFHVVNRKFVEIFEPTLGLGQALTKQLVDTSLDALGILICVRLNQHFSFELQRRKVPSMEGYMNGTSMSLWPRFQMVMDVHCESLRKATTALPGKPAGSALTLTGFTASTQSIAPHQTTQRFANFMQGILALSGEAGDDEPVHNSLGRLRNDFDAFLVKLSKGFAEVKKRERFLVNNYSLVGTIIADTEGKMAEELRDYFGEKCEELGSRG